MLLADGEEAPGWTTARVREGDILCEWSIAYDHPSNVTVMALDHVVIWSINIAALNNMNFGAAVLNQLRDSLNASSLTSIPIFEGMTKQELEQASSEVRGVTSGRDV